MAGFLFTYLTITTMLELRTKLFFDIETIPGPIAPEREDVKVPANYKKQETIDKYIDENLSKEWAKQSFNPKKGVVLCLSIAIDNGEPKIFTGNERDIFMNLSLFLENNGVSSPIWIAHNAAFDLGFTYLRALKYECKALCRLLPSNMRSQAVYDTQDKMMPYAYKEYTSLDASCKYFSIKSSKEGGVDGSKVWEYHLEGRDQEIYDYCNEDVKVLRDLFNCLNPDWDNID
jgi:hypothetical protein